MGIFFLYLLISLFIFYKLMRSIQIHRYQLTDILRNFGYSFGFIWVLIPYVSYHMIKQHYMIKKMYKEGTMPISINTSNYLMKYVYHSPFNGNHKPRVTVVGLLNEDTGRLNIGIARCSKEDMFSRKVGREIAKHRAINSERKRETVKVDEKSKEEMDDVFYRTAKTLSDVVLKDTYSV